MYSYRAFALFFLLTDALLAHRGTLSLEEQPQTSGVTKTDHQRTLGKIANDDLTLKNILPLVTFECLGKSGYFADTKFDCEVFHYCDPDGSRSTFHCPKNFFFNSELMVCELISENKKSMCWKKEDGAYKDKKALNKSMSDAKLKISSSTKKKSIEKYPSKSKATFVDDLDREELKNVTPKMDGIMTLEDVLAYMNSDSDPEHPKTFISTFLKMSGDRSAKALVNTSIISPFKKMKDHSSAGGNEQVVGTQITSSKEEKTEADVKENSDSREIKLRKRKRGRRGRTLNSEGPWLKISSERHHSHVSARSPAEHPQQDDMEESQNYGLWDDNISTTESAPSLRLFNVESRRNTTDPWRKRRRQNRRRRKYKTQTSSPVFDENLQDNITDVYDQTTGRFQQDHLRKSKKLDNAEWQRPTPSSERVEVQSPPVNTASFEPSYSRDINQPIEPNVQHHPTNRSHGLSEVSNIGNAEGKVVDGGHRNPWFKSTSTTEEDNYNIRFGERTPTSGTGFAPEPYYGDENGSLGITHFFGFEEEQDRKVNQNAKNPVVFDETSGQKPKQKYHNDRKGGSSRRGTTKSYDQRPADDERKHAVWNPDDTKEKEKDPFDSQFSTSKDQAKTHTPTLHKQEIDWTNKWSPVVSEVTTLPPTLPLKPAFTESYDPGIPAFIDGDGTKWKQREKSESRTKTKVPVGSSYKTWKEEPKVRTQEKPALNNTPPTTQKYQTKPVRQPTRNVHRGRMKEWPKHTMAHQHLSKVMNDFLAIPPMNLGLPKVSPMALAVPLETYVPKYRIPNEDIYVSESIAEEVIKNNPEIFDILDLITKSSRASSKETTKSNDAGLEDHGLTIKDAFLTLKSMSSDKRKTTSSDDIEITNIRETLEDILATSVEKLIGTDSSKEYAYAKDAPRIIKGAIRKLAELSKEEQEELKQITEIAKFTSLRLKPFLSSVLGDTSKEKSGDVKTTVKKPTRSTVLTAKKVPVSVLYSDDISMSKESAPKSLILQPTKKAERKRAQIPRFPIMRPPPPHPPPVLNPNIPFVVLHPPSLRPPHPPPLPPPKPAYPPMHMPYHRAPPPMYLHHHFRHPYIPRRQKRSPQLQRFLGNSRRWSNSPFAQGVVSSFTPAYGPPLFRRPFTQQRFPIPSLPNPFRFNYPLSSNTGILRQRKPRLRKPVFLPRQPVRNIPQPAQQQTVIIEEVPIPIPVEVPDHSMSRLPPRNPMRATESIRTQRPVHPQQNQRGQSTALTKPVHFHHPPFPFGVGVLESKPQSRPAQSAYSQISNPSQGILLTPGMREPKFQFALRVPQNPGASFPLGINPNSNRNLPNRAVKPKPQVILTPAEFHKRPHPPEYAFSFDPKHLHVTSYPNFPYFSGPPASFAHFLSAEEEKKHRHSGNSNGSRKPPKPSREVQSRPSSSAPGRAFDVKYRETGSRGSTPSNVGITSSPGGLFVVSPPDSSTFPQHLNPNNQNAHTESSAQYNWSEESKESSENGIPNERPKAGSGSSSAERKTRRRRPGSRRRRPRPSVAHQVQNSSTDALNQSDFKPSLNVWRSSNPPQQIPPPPSEITSDPLSFDIRNEEHKNVINNYSLNIPNESGLNISDAKSSFPPAGYYGSEQLSQILDTSFSSSGSGVHANIPSDSSAEIRPETLSMTEQPAEDSNLFSQEEAEFYHDDVDGHDGVPFGTRLKNRPRSRGSSRQNTKLQISSVELPKDIRNIHSVSPLQGRYVNRGASYREPGNQNTDVRDAVQPPSRRKPERFRYPGHNGRPNRQHEIRGIRPEVIYYDTREHPDGLFKIESEVPDSRPPTPVLVRPQQGNRDIFHLPNPYVDRDLFGMHPPPTAKPASSSAFYGSTPLRSPPRERTPPPIRSPPPKRPPPPGRPPTPERSPPREKEKDFVIPRRPHADHASGGSSAVSNVPLRPSSFRQEENTQYRYRVREKKRPTSAPPKMKSEVRTSSLIPETTTTTTRPHLYSTQVDQKPKEFHKPPEYPYYQHKEESTVSPKDVVTPRWKVKTTTTSAPFTVPEPFKDDRVAVTTAENLETKTTVDKPSGFLPVRDLQKSIQGAKLNLSKINATISTSVSVSSSSTGNHVSSAESSAEGQPKKVFSSKNGGLAVVRKGPRQRKRNRNRVRTTSIPKIENPSSIENGLNEDEKLQIAASIQDIIKATSESERAQGTPPPTTNAMNSTTESSKVSKKWILPPPEDVTQSKKIT